VRYRNGVGPRHRDDAEAPERKCAWKPRFFPSSRTSNSKQYSVTDGRIALGTVELTGGAFIAVDTTGQTLGTFATVRAAMVSFGRPQ
jgi:hypothetical protein